MNDNLQSQGRPEDEPLVHQKYAKAATKGIVELGILSGDTTRFLLDSNREITVYGIDPIVPDSMNPNLVGSIERIKSLVSEYQNFVFVRDYSFNVVKEWVYPFDYLFIDADHRYEMVKNDFESWFIKLEPGGVVAIHDSAANRGGPYWWPGPSRLADELLIDNRVEYLETFGALTVFRKKHAT